MNLGDLKAYYNLEFKSLSNIKYFVRTLDSYPSTHFVNSKYIRCFGCKRIGNLQRNLIQRFLSLSLFFLLTYRVTLRTYVPKIVWIEWFAPVDLSFVSFHSYCVYFEKGRSLVHFPVAED